MRFHRLTILLVFIVLGCGRQGSNPQSGQSAGDADTLFEDVIRYMIVEHEPDEYPPEVRKGVKDGLPSLAKSYKTCSPQQLEILDKNMRVFLDYEDSQYADVSRWYAQLADAVKSKDGARLEQLKKASVVSDKTRAIAGKLPGKVKKLAEDQMKGADGAADTLSSAIPEGRSLTSSNVQAGQEAAAKFHNERKKSYSKSYGEITGKDLPSLSR